MARTLGTKRLKKAIRHNKKKNVAKQSFLITYKKMNGRTIKRKVSPNDLKYGLLYGYDHKRKDLRSYRMDRMVSMKKVAFLSGFQKRAIDMDTLRKANRGLKRHIIRGTQTLTKDMRLGPVARKAQMGEKLKFWKGFKKQSSLTHGLELAGLGTLAVPSVHALRDPKSTPKERRHAKYEIGGLGILAAPSAVALGKKFLGK
ncbi:MAG: WYL domain-containing protein [Proteobacteria bacterium]|nr:WYL domain-containing protein [Pseudomonadota bacterium]